MRRSYKYRLWTNANQNRELGIMIESHRRLYNACLDQRKTAYDTGKRSVRYTEQSAWFTGQRAVNPYFARLNFSSAQDTMRRLDKAFTAFFRRLKSGEKPGYPRFKGRDGYDSFTFPAHGVGCRLTGNRLRVQYIGVLRVKLHRPHQGIIKTVTIKREAGKWYVVLSCDLGDVAVSPSELPPVGIDVGLSHFLATSDGETEPNPRFLKETLPRLRRAGRSVSRKNKGGKNRRKAVRRLARIHARVKNLRREHHHQVALKIVRRYGLVAVESLNIRGMLRNGRLARSIADAGWSGFLQTLRCKAESAGATYVEVDPRGTSQECSACGAMVPKDLSCRTHACTSCSLVLDRDVNAALNILARGLARTGPAGVKGYASPIPRIYRLNSVE